MRGKVNKTGELIHDIEIRIDPTRSLGDEKLYYARYLDEDGHEFICDLRKITIFEPDWEKRRYEVAKDVLTAFISHDGTCDDKQVLVETSKEIADALITELKKEKNEYGRFSLNI